MVNTNQGQTYFHAALTASTNAIGTENEMTTQWSVMYTLSHPEKDRDVTERAQGYTLQDASFMRQSSRCSFLNA